MSMLWAIFVFALFGRNLSQDDEYVMESMNEILDLISEYPIDFRCSKLAHSRFIFTQLVYRRMKYVFDPSSPDPLGCYAEPNTYYPKLTALDPMMKGLFALMLARLDEFDSLTPLILTPSTPVESVPQSATNRFPTSDHPSSSQPYLSASTTSPPPPRRPQAGKTLIVPLGSSGRFHPPAVPLLGTPDSRVTSFEGGTTKSCATIPEDDEHTESPDLVSIDRTSMAQPCDVKVQRCYHSSYNLTIPTAPPDFQVPAPSYGPPPAPNGSRMERPERLRLPTNDRPTQTRDRVQVPIPVARRIGSDSASGSLGSPQSSLGSGSPLDTTGSPSDSFYLDNNQSGSDVVRDDNDNKQQKYELHRIEEESEHYSEFQTDDRPCGSGTAIPRSISQQLEYLQRNRT